jgi:hypothetical protein
MLDSEATSSGVESPPVNRLTVTQQYLGLVGVYQGVAITAVRANLDLVHAITLNNLKIAQKAFQVFTPKE